MFSADWSMLLCVALSRSTSRQVRQVGRSTGGATSRRSSASGCARSTIAGSHLGIRIRLIAGAVNGRPLGENSLADVAQSVGDVSGKTVATEHVTHVLPGRAVACHVSEVPEHVIMELSSNGALAGKRVCIVEHIYCVRSYRIAGHSLLTLFFQKKFTVFLK